MQKQYGQSGYVSEKIVSRHFGLSISLLQKLRSRGVGPGFYRAGGKILYTLDEVDHWIKSSRHPSPLVLESAHERRDRNP